MDTTLPEGLFVRRADGTLEIEPALVKNSQELRFLVSLVRVVARKGYADTTVDDLVADARASKRTFYKYFAGRRDCMVRSYDVVVRTLVNIVNDHLPPGGDQIERFNAGLSTMLDLMVALPEVTFCFLVEFPGAGAAASEKKNQLVEQIGHAIVKWDQASAPNHPEYPEISEAQAIGLTAAIYELMYWKARRDGVGRLHELGPELTALHALIYAHLKSPGVRN